MGAKTVRRIFFYLALGAVALLAALQVTLARAGDPAARQEAPWLSPLRDMDEALARGDLAVATAARHKAHLAALANRRWEGFFAVGDATFRLGEATQNRRAMEAAARRAYLSALFRARNARSLDGVLQVTEVFARLGDRDVVLQGIRVARDLAGRDETAQDRVRASAQRWASWEPSSSALDPQITLARAL